MSFVALRKRISDFKIIMVNEVKLEFKTKTVITSGEGLLHWMLQYATIEVGEELIKVCIE